MESPSDHTLDVVGRQCPVPVIRCRAALACLETGETIRVITTDPDCRREIPGLIALLGEELVRVEQHSYRTTFYIRRLSRPRSGLYNDHPSRLAKLLDLFSLPLAAPAR